MDVVDILGGRWHPLILRAKLLTTPSGTNTGSGGSETAHDPNLIAEAHSINALLFEAPNLGRMDLSVQQRNFDHFMTNNGMQIDLQNSMTTVPSNDFSVASVVLLSSTVQIASMKFTIHLLPTCFLRHAVVYSKHEHDETISAWEAGRVFTDLGLQILPWRTYSVRSFGVEQHHHIRILFTHHSIICGGSLCIYG